MPKAASKTETTTKTDEQTAPDVTSDSFHGELVNEDANHHGKNGLPPVENADGSATDRKA